MQFILNSNKVTNSKLRKMKKIYQSILVIASLALVACGTLGGGDTDVSNNADFKSYKGICAKYMQARIHAANCVGNNDEANKMQAQLDQLKKAKNLSDTKAVLDASKMPEMDKAVKLASESAKKEFVESLGYLIGGVAQEKILLDKVLQSVKTLQQEAASNPFGSAASQLSFLTSLSDSMGTDLKNVAVTIDAYTVYATENGISMDDVNAVADKVAKQSDLED